MTRAVVIGGGIAGLASAALLARDGYQVTLLEKNAEFGGRAGSWEHEGFRFDTGPSWYLMPEVFDHFFRLLGTTADEQFELVQLDPGYRVFGEGYDEPLDISADAEENIELFESVERGAGAKLRQYLGDAAEIYQLAIQKFLYSTFEKLSPVFTREVIGRGRRLSSLLLTPLSRLTARTVKDRRLRQILGYPAVFLGSSPDRAPSMYSLMSHLDLVEGVLYPMGGFTRVISAIENLAVAEGAELRSGVTVRRILVEQGAATGVEIVDADGAVGFVDAEVVVSTVDLHHSETVLLDQESERSYPQSYWDDRVAGPSALLLYLGVSGELPELEHHSLFFSADWKSNFDAIFGKAPHVPADPSLYVCKPSGVDPEVAPEGAENVFVLVPLPADPALGHGGIDRGGDEAIEALADSVIARIGSATGIPDLADRIVVRRTVGPADFVDRLNSWKGSALGPAHTLRQSAFFRAGNVSTKVRDLYFAGSSTIPGIGLPMCLISAELVVKRLRGDVSPSPLAEPLQASR
jgi:phytoene desaturase